MSSIRLNANMVAATVVLFCSTLALNELLFTRLELVPGINWIYLPAGVRLLCTLLFGEAGAFGLLIVSWAVCFLYFFPNDPMRSLMGGLIGAAAPYLAYRMVRPALGTDGSLAKLTPSKLLLCALAYSIASPLLHHLWFALEGHTEHILYSFSAMAVGDLSGTLIVLYSVKGMLRLLPRA